MQQQQKFQVPSIEELQKQITQLMLQRSQMKEQVEQVDRQLPVLNGMLQILVSQAEQESVKD